MVHSIWAWIAEHATVLSTVISAIAAGVVATFTIKLTGATAGQLAKLGEAAKLAREEFVATHRPRIVVRFIDGPDDHNPEGVVTAGITFASVGASEARIVALGASWGIRRDGGWL